MVSEAPFIILDDPWTGLSHHEKMLDPPLMINEATSFVVRLRVWDDELTSIGGSQVTISIR